MLALLATVALLVWIGLFFFRRDFWRADQWLEDSVSIDGGRWPEVVIVVPARNEAAIIGRTLPTLFAQDYPGRFRVVVVDDASTDGTGALAAAMARSLGPDAEARVSVVAGQPLPAGWVGKPWAMHRGLSVAEELAPEARYTLFTDADIAHEPGVLRALVARAERDGRHMVSVMARLQCESRWERLLIPAFVYFFQKLYPFPAVNDPHSPVAAAAGGCMLVRTDTLRRLGGLTLIRDRIIDDCALARLIKLRGPLWLGFHAGVRSLRPYAGFAGLWEMVARTAYVQLDYRPVLLAGTVAGMALTYLVPPLAIVAGLLTADPAALIAGLGAMALMGDTMRPTLAMYGRSVAWALLLPFTALLYTLMTLDSARQFRAGQGGGWKGRAYGPQAPGRSGPRPGAPVVASTTAAAAARHACRVVWHSGTSFFWAMALMDRRRRRAMFAVYAFCRVVDNVADDEPDADRRAAGLATWREEVDAIFAQRRPRLTVAVALAEAVQAFALRRQDCDAIIDGMEMDANGPIRAPALAELDLYCDRVASAVGRLSVRVFGLADEDGDALSHALGRALQLTNILRDVAEDAERGRLYLPRELLAEHGIPADTEPLAVLAHPGLSRVCLDLAHIARGHFDAADVVLARCDRRRARPAIMMMVVYRRLLDRLIASAFYEPTRRVRLSAPEKIRLMVRAMTAG